MFGVSPGVWCWDLSTRDLPRCSARHLRERLGPPALRGGAAVGEQDFPRPALMPLLEFVDGLDHLRQVDFVDFAAPADGLEQRDGELAAEVFAKFFKALQDHQVVVRVHVEQFVGEQLEAELFEQV